jgi:hypothetical protein
MVVNGMGSVDADADADAIFASDVSRKGGGWVERGGGRVERGVRGQEKLSEREGILGRIYPRRGAGH